VEMRHQRLGHAAGMARFVDDQDALATPDRLGQRRSFGRGDSQRMSTTRAFPACGRQPGSA
jgi:hypothetical protein